MDKQQLKSTAWLITYTAVLLGILFNVKAAMTAVAVVLAILSPVFIGLAIALILARPYNRIRKHFEKGMANTKAKRWAKPLALLTTYAAMVAMVIIIISFVVPSLTESVQLFADSVDGYVLQISEFGEKLMAFFNLDNIALADFDSLLNKIFAEARNFIGSIFPQIFSFTQSVVKSAINVVLGIILSVYFLGDREKLSKNLRRMLFLYLPEQKAKKTWHVLEISAETFSNFISGQATDSALLGIFCFVGMGLLGLGYPLLISTIIAVTSLVPVVGAIIGCVPAGFILFLVSPSQVLIFLIFFIVLQQFDNNVVYPKIVGTSIGLPALWVLFAIIVGGGLFGALGMLLGVPCMSVVYRLMQEDMAGREEVLCLQEKRKAEKLSGT